MKAKDSRTAPVPEAMRVQLARLFGSNSREVTAETRTTAQWRRTLRKILHELDRYLAENVDTDELHRLMLLSGLMAAHESLKEEDFWPGYLEGIIRLALLLMGDYPDHRRRKPGRRNADHYRLDRLRSARWVQTPDQRVSTLLAAGAVGFPQLGEKPRDVLDDFRQRYGFEPSLRDFLEWYRQNRPADYSALFR